MATFFYALVACLLLQVSATTKPFPKISEQFSMQINMTSVVGNHVSVAGIETMAYDMLNQRSHIFVVGPAFPVAFGQIVMKETNPPPNRNAWFAQYEQEGTGKGFTCKNETVDMEWHSFWNIPGAEYSGQAHIGGTLCDQWTTKKNAQGQYDVLSVAADGSNRPVQIVINTSVHKFVYWYNEWKPGAPPLSKFQVPKGTKCTSSAVDSVDSAVPIDLRANSVHPSLL